MGRRMEDSGSVCGLMARDWIDPPSGIWAWGLGMYGGIVGFDANDRFLDPRLAKKMRGTLILFSCRVARFGELENLGSWGST